LDEVQFQPLLYDMVWMRLKAVSLPKLKLLTKANGQFNSIEGLSDPAADVEIEPKQYDKQRQKSQGVSSCPAGSKLIFRQ